MAVVNGDLVQIANLNFSQKFERFSRTNFETVHFLSWNCVMGEKIKIPEIPKGPSVLASSVSYLVSAKNAADAPPYRGA